MPSAVTFTYVPTHLIYILQEKEIEIYRNKVFVKPMWYVAA